MNDLSVIWTPTPKQAVFLACPVYEAMYGGAKGGGKTDALLFDHVPQHHQVHDHWEKTGLKSRGMALILRKAFGRLKDFINRAHTYFPVLSAGAMKWKESEHTWFCACGYRVWFGHCEGPRDHELYQGQEISRFALDQAEELPFYQYSYVKLQVRASQPMLRDTLAVRVSANPLGQYADWVKKRFVTPAPNGFEIISETIDIERDGVIVPVVRDRVFIPAGLRDNPHLPADYEAELMEAPEHLRRAFLFGDWDVTPGSFFGDVFDPNIHVIDDLGPTEIRIPSNWQIFRCADWGSRNPAACYWVAIDNDGLLIVLDEFYGPGEEPISWGKKLLAIEERWGWVDKKPPYYSKLQGYLDPACFKDDVSGGPKIADRLFEIGMNWYSGDNQRKPGWVEVRRRLIERGGISGKVPGLRICRRCTNLIRTLPNLTAPDKETGGDQDDIDTKQEDHAADALRYGLMSRPMPRYQKDVEEDDLKRWERIMMTQATRGESARNRTTGY